MQQTNFSSPAPPARRARALLLGVDCDNLIVFDKWVTGKSYKQIVMFKNVGGKPIKILPSMPSNSCFSIPFPEPIIIPTGLSVGLPITFTPTLEREETSALKVFLPDIEESFSIDLLAKLAVLSAKLPDLVDFGFVGVGETNIHSFEVVNDGDVTFDFKVEARDPFVILSPKGTCVAGGSVAVQCSCTPLAAGHIDASFVVTIKGTTTHHVVPVKVVAKYPNLILSINDHRFDGKLLTAHEEEELSDIAGVTMPHMIIPGIVGSGFKNEEHQNDKNKYIPGYHEYLHLRDVIVGTQVTTTFRVENAGQVRTTFTIEDTWAGRKNDLYVVGPPEQDETTIMNNTESDSIGANANTGSSSRINRIPTFLKVVPRKGELVPGDHLDVSVTFSAHTPNILVNEELEVISRGKVARFLTIKAFSAPPKLVIDNSVVAFGYVQVGKKQRMTVSLKNESPLPCYFQVSAATPSPLSQSLEDSDRTELTMKPSPFLSPLRSPYNIPPGPFKVFPSSGIIASHIAQIITVEFSPSPFMAMLPTSMLFMILISGGDPIPMLVTGSPVPMDNTDHGVLSLMKPSILGEVSSYATGGVDKLLNPAQQISISDAQPRPAPSSPEYVIIANALQQFATNQDLISPLDPAKLGGRIPQDSLLFSPNLPEFSANEYWSGNVDTLIQRTLFQLQRVSRDPERVVTSRMKFEKSIDQYVSQADRFFIAQKVKTFLSVSNALSYELCGNFGNVLDSPSIYISTNAIDFGYCPFNARTDKRTSLTKKENIIVFNVGNIPYKLSVTLAPGPYSSLVFGTTTDFVIVPPRSRRFIEISFRPNRQGGEFGAILELTATPSQITTYQALINCIVPAPTIHRVHLVGRSHIDDDTPGPNVPTYACSVSFPSTPGTVVLRPCPIGAISQMTIPIRNEGDQPLSYRLEFFDLSTDSWRICDRYFSPSTKQSSISSNTMDVISDGSLSPSAIVSELKQSFGSSLAVNPPCGLIPAKSTTLLVVVGIPHKAGRWLYHLRALFGGCRASVNIQPLSVFITGEEPAVSLERTLGQRVTQDPDESTNSTQICELGFGGADEELGMPNTLDLEANELSLVSERPPATVALPSVSLDSSVTTSITFRSVSSCTWFLILLPPPGSGLRFTPPILTLRPYDSTSTIVNLEVPSSGFTVGKYNRIVTVVSVAGCGETELPKLMAQTLNMDTDTTQEGDARRLIWDAKNSGGYALSAAVLQDMVEQTFTTNVDVGLDLLVSRFRNSLIGKLSRLNYAGLRLSTAIIAKELELTPMCIDGMSLIVGKKHRFELKLRNNTSTYIAVQLFIEKPRIVNCGGLSTREEPTDLEIAKTSLNLDITSLPLMNETDDGLQLPPNTEVSLILVVRALRRGAFVLRFGAVLNSLSSFSKRMTQRSMRKVRRTVGDTALTPGRALGRGVTEAVQVIDIEKEDISLQSGGAVVATFRGCGALPRVQISSITSATTPILDLVDSIDIEGLNEYLDGQISDVEQEIRRRSGVLITQEGLNLMDGLRVFPMALGPSVPTGLSPDTDLFTHYTLTLTNPTGVPVKISLSLPSERSPSLTTAPWAHQVPTNEDEKMKELIANEIFAVWPRDYVIKPHGSELMNIRYRHSRPGLDVMKVLLDVESGKMVVMELHGQTLHPKEPAIIAPSVVQLLPALVGHTYISPIQYIRLRNPSNIKCGFVIDTSELNEANRHLGLVGKPALVLANPSGSVDRFADTYLKLTFQPSVCDTFELSLPLYLIPLGKDSKLHSRTSIHSSVAKTDSPNHVFIPKLRPRKAGVKRKAVHVETYGGMKPSDNEEKKRNNAAKKAVGVDKNKINPGQTGTNRRAKKGEVSDQEEEVEEMVVFSIPDNTEPYLTIVLRGGGIMYNNIAPIPLSLIPEYYTVPARLNNTLLNSGTYPTCHIASLDTSLVCLGCLPALCLAPFSVKLTSRADVGVMFKVCIPGSFLCGIYGNLVAKPSSGVLQPDGFVIIKFELSSLLANGNILVSPYVAAVDEIRIDLAYIAENGTHIQKQAEVQVQQSPAYIGPDTLKSVTLMKTLSSAAKQISKSSDREQAVAGVNFSSRRIFAIREGIPLPKTNNSGSVVDNKRSSTDGPLSPPPDYFAKRPVSKSNIHMDSLSFVLCFYRAETEAVRDILIEYDGLPQALGPYYPCVPIKPFAPGRRIVETCSSSTARDWMGKEEQGIVTGVIETTGGNGGSSPEASEVLLKATSLVQTAIQKIYCEPNSSALVDCSE